MSDVVFQIVGDPSKADKAIDTVMDRLEALKRKAAQDAVTPGIDKMAAGFAKLGDAIRKEQQALTRTTQLHQQLTAQNAPLAKSFASVAEAIQREQQMLEKIHGPARQYAQDVQTLNALMAKGAISANQHAAQMKGLTGVSTTRGMLGSVRGFAATAAAGLGAGAGFSAVDDYQNMQNRLRFLTGGDIQQVNSLFGQLQGVSERTRQSLGATTETFVKVSMATKQMGMSTGQTMQFMERLNKAVALSGASSSAAEAGLMQLSQGLSAGALRGEEFNSVVEQIPAVAKVIADSLGVTTGQLRTMAQDGKLTADVVVNAFNKMGTTIDKDFGNTLPTVGQQWQVFKDKMVVTFGELDKSIGVSSALGNALGMLGGIVRTLLEPVQMLGKAFGEIGISSSMLMGAVGGGLLLGGPLGALAGAGVGFAMQEGAFQDGVFTEWVKAHKEVLTTSKDLSKVYLDIKSSTDEWGNAVTNVSHQFQEMDFAAQAALARFNKNAEDTRQLEKDLDAFQTLTGTFNRGQLTVSEIKPSDEAIRKAKALREEYEKLARALLGVESVSARAIRLGAAEREAQQAQNDYVAQLEANTTPAVKLFALELDKLEQAYVELGMTEEAYMTERNRLYADAFDKGVFGDGKPANDIWKAGHEDWQQRVKMYEDINDKSREFAEEQKRQAQEVSEAWAAGMGSVAASLHEMIRKNEVSMSRLGEQLAILAIRMAAMNVGGAEGAFLSSFAGGLTGFASGGVVYQGNGGTDSQIYAFRKSPNESVTHIIETPEQRRTGSLRGGSGGGMPPKVVVSVQRNTWDIMDGDSFDAQYAMASVQRR